jgi:chromate reductase
MGRRWAAWWPLVLLAAVWVHSSHFFQSTPVSAAALLLSSPSPSVCHSGQSVCLENNKAVMAERPSSSRGPRDTLHIVAICGSLRGASTNLGLLRAIKKQLPPDATIDIIVPGDLPLFNQDIEGTPSEAVTAFRARVKAAHAFIFAACEYNFSLSAALKNAIDWASRGPDGNLFKDKAAAIVSTGGAGGLRAQNHLRDIGVFLDLHFLNHPSLMVRIGEKPSPVDWSNGDLVSESALESINPFLTAYLAWSRRIHSSR